MKSESELLRALANYCSQTERCVSDVRKKIQAENLDRSENLSREAEHRLIDTLLKEKFIDENRFARSFVHDKFQFNHWGRIKIGYELRIRGISPDIYHEALETVIDEDEYLAVLSELLLSKKRMVKGRTPQETYQKLCRFAVTRGFESSLIINILKKMFIIIDDD